MKKILIVLLMMGVVFGKALNAYAQISGLTVAVVPKELAPFIDINLDVNAIDVCLNRNFQPSHINEHFNKNCLVIPFEADLREYRGPFDDKSVQNYAFVYFNSAGEEDSSALYVKEVNKEHIVLLWKGTMATGDGGAIPFTKEFTLNFVEVDIE